MAHSSGDNIPSVPTSAAGCQTALRTTDEAKHVGLGVERVRTKNRRKRYLDLHPEYFHNPDLELVDPLLHDRLVRRFQTAKERENDGRAKGYTRMLEADLIRSEARLAAIRDPDPAEPVAYRQTDDGAIVEENAGEAMGRDEAWERWVDIMGQRFLRGEDTVFDYSLVDGLEEYDDRGEEDRAALEKYLDGQEEEFVGSGSPKGETGVQDF